MKLENLNTDSGLVLVLAVMWLLTLGLIMGLGVWVLHKGIDPQNQVVTNLFAVLIGTAFGSVNGALFTSMKGNTKHLTPELTITPNNPPSVDKPSSQGKETQGQPIPPAQVQPQVNV